MSLFQSVEDMFNRESRKHSQNQKLFSDVPEESPRDVDDLRRAHLLNQSFMNIY